MGKKNKPHRFERLKVATMSGAPAVVRMSTILRKLREEGHDTEAAAVEDAAKAVLAGGCPNCGRAIDDPVVGVVPGDVAFACPWCSSPEVLAIWQREGELEQN